jgi:hypothetical protein
VDAIDWNASARLSSARGTDEFVVRERFAEEAPRVVVVADRRPEMTLFPASLPWLSKPTALRHAREIIFESGAALRGVSGYLDYADGEPFWEPPRSQHEPVGLESRGFGAPADTLELALDHLVEHRRSLPTGTFVFLLSDFVCALPEGAWTRVLQQRWDIVPVVIQDPVWEQSFPPVGGVIVPFWDPRTKQVKPIRMSEREAEEKREANEARLEALIGWFRDHDLEPVVLSSHERHDVLASFLDWADLRRYSRGRAW